MACGAFLSSASLGQESVAFRVAKCCSRCGDTEAAVAGVEQLLYTRNFWSEKYRLAISPRFSMRCLALSTVL